MVPEESSTAADSSKEGSGSSFPVVALGASAGGLGAVSQLLRHLGDKPGVGIVLVQHLDPTHASNLVELLSRVTRLPVEAVRDGLAVEIDHVYVIPPGTEMAIGRGILHLSPRSGAVGPHLPIDAFFGSLAEDRGPAAIGVILSGTGSDGARGTQSIKAEGGITFAQKGAEHTGMPESAIATGAVDFVLPAEEIAVELPRVAARLPRRHEELVNEGPAYDRILAAIRLGTGVDFTHYKPTTLRRRMQRRAIIRRAASLTEYADLVAAEPAEVEALAEEVLIHVTSFFRDPQVFEALKKDVFPRLISNRRADSPIRVWIPGCSSGEEVYSIAICLLELLSDAGASQIPLKIFGTDVSRRAIERARAGTYPESVAQDVGPGRLARFFMRSERGYEVLKEVRDRCVFAIHDITRDPPFSKMDLISCRNLMIYLGPTLQQRILPMFHYALNEPGFLVLGTAETVGTFAGFSAVDLRNRIYARAPGPPRLGVDFVDSRGWPAPSHVYSAPANRVANGDVRKDADRAILSAISPAGVVVTDGLAIVEFRGEIAPYLEPVPGVATLDLLRMAREELRLPLRRAIDEARTTGRPSRGAGVVIASGETRRSVDVDVIPFGVVPANGRFFAVLFTERVAPPQPEVSTEPGRAEAEDTLTRELASTREYLQSVIQQLEVGNEELKAANEEIISSNEELQSTNEELQTAKEELQATNEELRTVNDEMLDRNVEATRLADDLANILSSVAIPIVILGRDSKIRRFTPTATKILNLIPGDVGRPITDIQAKIRIPDLSAQVADVLQHLVPLESTVQSDEGRWYQLCVRPYRTLDNRIDGTVLSVYDIDALKKAEFSLGEARDFARSIVETMRECLVVLDGDLRVRSANRAFCQQFRTTPEALDGRHLDVLGGGGSVQLGLAGVLADLAAGQQVEGLRLEREFPEIGRRTVIVNGRRLAQTGWFLLTLVDVTDRARTEERLARSEAGFRRMLASAAEPILMSDPKSRIVFANEMAKRVFGYPGDELLALEVGDLVPERLREGHALLHARFLAAPAARPMGPDRVLVARRKGGEEFPVEVALSPMDGSEGLLVVMFVSDISARKEAELKLADYQTQLQRMVFQSALVEERERRRIAQDLHDRIGQSLALARIKLEGVRGSAAGETRSAVDAAVELIATSIEDTRTLTFELAPPVLYDLGLKAALSWLCEETEKRTGVHVEIVDDGPQRPFDETTSALIFRAVRELLTNVFKHAQTPVARIALRQGGDHFEIAVEDEGAGFDVEKTARGPNSGFGLFSVREQIARLGGSVEVQSTPREGTRVTLRVPSVTTEPAQGKLTGGGMDEDPAGG